MNWLAHAFLSPAEPMVRLGNLLADLVKGRERKAMPEAFLAGVRRHQAIDAFTDMHPLFGQSRRRLSGRWGRFGCVLVDIFYDHYLAKHWACFAAGPLEVFTQGVYHDLRTCPFELPPLAQEAAYYMIRDDRLASYREVEGLRTALARLSMRIAHRVGREVALAASVDEMLADDAGFEGDFLAFFPQLQAHIEAWSAGRD